MKLSEAIRLGAMMGPQVFGDLFDSNGGSCAIGAASKAIGAEVSATFNWLFSARITCPECSLRDTQFFIILCLNDIHHWSRERIADWVQTIEPAENSWLAKKYGKLGKDWREEIRAGFAECFRVLKPHGTMIFKWNEHDIPVSQVLALTPERPIIGNRCGKSAKSHWIVFLKRESEVQP